MMDDADGRVGLGERCTSPFRAPTNHAEKFQRFIVTEMKIPACSNVLSRIKNGGIRQMSVCLGVGYTETSPASSHTQDMDRQFLR